MTTLPEGFGVLILTHGRPTNQRTLAMLREGGYSGRVWLVIDDEDASGGEYRRLYGDLVITFCKREIAAQTDAGDNLDDRRSVLYARNAVWGVARDLGLRWLLVLDDDYGGAYIRFDSRWNFITFNVGKAGRLDAFFAAGIEALRSTGSAAFCYAQGGDFIGGFPAESKLIVARRKAMNTWFFDVSLPLWFSARMNDDVSTYVEASRRGLLFLTSMLASVNQNQTQATAGGLTEMYMDFGTYRKSFYSVMFCPSAVKIGYIGDHRSPHDRLHHYIDWGCCAPKIVPERFSKASG